MAEAHSAFGVAAVAGRLLEVLREIRKITGEIVRLNPSINVATNIAVLNSPQFIALQDGLLRVAREQAENSVCRIALVGATASDVRDVIILGESRLMAIGPSWNRPVFETSYRRPSP